MAERLCSIIDPISYQRRNSFVLSRSSVTSEKVSLLVRYLYNGDVDKLLPIIMAYNISD